MEVMFLASKTNLTAKFTNLTKIPTGATLAWDFGDSSEVSSDRNPTHTYSQEGFYQVTLTVNSDDNSYNYTSTVVVSEKVKTTLSGSIYELISTYLPESLKPYFTFAIKLQYIEKWQYFIGPLVNREDPLPEFTNELYYEALENQLIMEAALCDFLIINLQSIIQQIAQKSVTVSALPSPESGDNNGQVKKIVTGPSEVEFYNNSDKDPDIITNLQKLTQKGGLIDILRQNILALADRLDIRLPNNLPTYKRPTVPEKVSQTSSF